MSLLLKHKTTYEFIFDFFKVSLRHQFQFPTCFISVGPGRDCFLKHLIFIFFYQTNAYRTEKHVHSIFPALRGSGQLNGINQRTHVLDCGGGNTHADKGENM